MLKCVRAFGLSVPVVASLLAAPSLAQKSPWGLRNFEKQQSGWSSSCVGQVYGGHEAGHVAFWLHWGDVQSSGGGVPCMSTSSNAFAVLDQRLDVAATLGADPVVVFHASAGFGGGAFWGMRTENGTPGSYTGPCDLQKEWAVQWPPPSPTGYSVALHDVTVAVAQEIVDFLAMKPGQWTVQMRFHNEAWTEWVLGSTTADWNQNLSHYARSYLTFRQAVEQVELANPGANVEFRVGHGSIPRGRLVPNYYYQLGLPAPGELRQQAINNVNAYTERNRGAIAAKFPPGTIVGPIDTWPEVVTYAAPTSGDNPRLDAWMNRFVTWTAAGYFEFSTIHQHGKPYFLAQEQSIFDGRVAAVPNHAPIPPWISAETAFELLDQSGWGVIPTPGAALDQFVAEDYGRKWSTLLALNTTFCTPVVGGPHPDYIGLFAPDGPPGQTYDCMPPPPPPPACFGGICPFPSNDAFVFLSNAIGRPMQPVENLSAGVIARYRFDPSDPANATIVDVVWRRTLFDSNSTTSSVTIGEPPSLPGAQAAVLDVLGMPAAPFSGVGSVTISALGQAPRVVVWSTH